LDVETVDRIGGQLCLGPNRQLFDKGFFFTLCLAESLGLLGECALESLHMLGRIDQP
jgi:hypothetical protein